MASTPQNPNANTTAGRAPRIVVLLGDEDGNDPTVDDEVDWLIPLEIQQTAGGGSPDQCRFALDLGRLGQRVQDIQMPRQMARQVEVRLVLEPERESAEPEYILLFWGELNVSTPEIIARGESLELTARVEDFHFGTILVGPRVWNPLDNAEVTLTDDVEFNPLIDGIIEPNMSDRSMEDGPTGSRLWIDPESVRTSSAEGEQDGDAAAAWELDRCVLSLQGLLNPDEEFIAHGDPIDVIPREGDTIPEPDNVRLRRGHYLPAYLDDLLHPWGFDWCLDYIIKDDGSRQVIVRVFDRRTGFENELYFQRPGEDLNVAKSNVPIVSIDANIAELANIIVGHGSLQQREITVELSRGWTEAEDDFSVDDLRPSDTNGQYRLHPTAWRLWVANEAGDYNDSRPEITEAIDLSSVFDDYVPKRRRLEDCLTLDSEIEKSRRRPPVVEWHNPETDVWEAVPHDSDWSYVVLREQMGIIFTGDAIPGILRDLGEDARIRVTATVTGDKRASAETEYDELSPQLREVKLFLDLSDRFHDRTRQTSGAFASILSGEADTVDNSSAMEEYLLDVQAQEVSGTIRASFTLWGLQFGYLIGDVLTKIDGRNISLNRNFSGDTPLYVQVTGIRWLIQEQATILICEPAGDFTG